MFFHQLAYLLLRELKCRIDVVANLLAAEDRSGDAGCGEVSFQR
jgi:hypothetical protein